MAKRTPPEQLSLLDSRTYALAKKLAAPTLPRVPAHLVPGDYLEDLDRMYQDESVQARDVFGKTCPEIMVALDEGLERGELELTRAFRPRTGRRGDTRVAGIEFGPVNYWEQTQVRDAFVKRAQACNRPDGWTFTVDEYSQHGSGDFTIYAHKPVRKRKR